MSTTAILSRLRSWDRRTNDAQRRAFWIAALLFSWLVSFYLGAVWAVALNLHPSPQ